MAKNYSRGDTLPARTQTHTIKIYSTLHWSETIRMGSLSYAQYAFIGFTSPSSFSICALNMIHDYLGIIWVYEVVCTNVPIFTWPHSSIKEKLSFQFILALCWWGNIFLFSFNLAVLVFSRCKRSQKIRAFIKSEMYHICSGVELLLWFFFSFLYFFYFVIADLH